MYMLESKDQNKTKQRSQVIKQHKKYGQVWLHHRRLGHPSFNLIKSLFPPCLPMSLLNLSNVIFINCQSIIVHPNLSVAKRVISHLT